MCDWSSTWDDYVFLFRWLYAWLVFESKKILSSELFLKVKEEANDRPDQVDKALHQFICLDEPLDKPNSLTSKEGVF